MNGEKEVPNGNAPAVLRFVGGPWDGAVMTVPRRPELLIVSFADIDDVSHSYEAGIIYEDSSIGMEFVNTARVGG